LRVFIVERYVNPILKSALAGGAGDELPQPYKPVDVAEKLENRYSDKVVI
jgi:hypothetical protein